MRERVKWVDVAKFFGIFAIFLGHFSQSGRFVGFVFSYHVPLFFFLSGCMSNYDKENNFRKFAFKKFKNIMIPFYVFSVVAILVTTIREPIYAIDLNNFIKCIIKGNVRNTFIAASLWFLSCLFIMELIFKLIKYLKNRILIFTICVGLYFIAIKLINPIPIITPHWLYNLDSALYYIIYYAIGYVMYPVIASLFNMDNILKKILFIFTGVLSLLYSICLFMGTELIISSMIKLPIINNFSLVIVAYCLIWFNLILSKLFENIVLFNNIGKSTLYLCCNEYIIEVLIFDFLATFGLNVILSNPLQVFILVMVIFVIAIKFIIPIEKLIAKNIKDFIEKLKVDNKTNFENNKMETNKEC